MAALVRRLVEVERRCVVADQVEVASSLWRRGLGLMGRARLLPGSGLWLEPCSSIHMLFMRFPLDVAFVDAGGTVLRIYPGLRPWRVTRWVRSARAAVELPAGTLEAAGVQVGSRLRLE